MNNENESTKNKSTATTSIVTRGIVGGVLMGLANLVPGISGGTMLVAAGVYQRFINAIADITTCKFKAPSMILLSTVISSALLSIILLAGPVKNLVVDHRWVMYSIFIGLTLGGIPVIWRMVNRATPGLWIGAVCGFVGMAIIALIQTMGSGDGASNTGFIMMLIAGMVAASAMILPGVSGGYLFLVLRVYVPVLAAIDLLITALKSGDYAQASDPLMNVVLPVGIGVVVGVAVVSHLLKFLLARYEKQTLGVLLGLLVGAVIGLWPFQVGVAPKVGEMFKRQTVVQLQVGQIFHDKLVIEKEGELILEGSDKKYEAGLALKETGRPIEADQYPTAFFKPTVLQISSALGLIIAGFGATSIIAKLGGEKKIETSPVQ